MLTSILFLCNVIIAVYVLGNKMKDNINTQQRTNETNAQNKPTVVPTVYVSYLFYEYRSLQKVPSFVPIMSRHRLIEPTVSLFTKKELLYIVC